MSMKVQYLNRREPLEETLHRTLSSGWSQQYGTEIRVSSPEQAGRLWLLQPRLSIYYAPHVGERARTFLRDNFRNNLATRRGAAQRLLITALTQPVGLRLLGRKAFRVSGALPAEASFLIRPGNYRIRVFNFESNTCRVFLKNGFDSASIRREVEVRSDGEGPFPRITSWGARYDWFEEPILDAVPLDRCPSPAFRDHSERKAFRLLDRWLQRSRREVSIADHSTRLLASIEACAGMLGSRLQHEHVEAIRRWCDRLGARAQMLRRIEVADSHGDLISGNILASPASEEVYIIDWEHCRERFYWYDHFVYGLRSRYTAGLAGRVRDFVLGNTESWIFDRLPQDREWRSAAAALFLLEDLATQLKINAAAAYYSTSEELQGFMSEVEHLGTDMP